MKSRSLRYVPKVFVDVSGLSRDEWLDYRRQGIGGSDAASILGISPFRTARDIYYDKLNIAPVIESEENWVALKIGHLLEDLVGEIFAVKTGLQIFKIKKMFQHPLYPYMLADIDFFVILPNGKIAILEIKTTNYHAKDNWWRDGQEIVPEYYEAQGRHYMAVMNVDEVYFCCLYGNTEDEVMIRHLSRDIAYEEELIHAEGVFWKEHVMKKVPPPYTEDAGQIMASLKRYTGMAKEGGPVIQLSGNSRDCFAKYLDLQARSIQVETKSKAYKEEMDRLKAMIVAEMGQSCEASCEIDGTSYTITYNPVRKVEIKKAQLTSLAAMYPEVYAQFATQSEYRRFNIKANKPEAA